MTTVSAATHSHYLIAQQSDEETREVWLGRYNTELCSENIVLRNCLKTKQQQQEIIRQQATQEIAQLKEKHAAEIAAMKQEIAQLKDEAARARTCNIRLMREAQSLREQFGYD